MNESQKVESRRSNLEDRIQTFRILWRSKNQKAEFIRHFGICRTFYYSRENSTKIFRVLKGRILNSKKHDAMTSWLPNVRFSVCSLQSLCVLRNALELPSGSINRYFDWRNNNLYYDFSSALHPVQNYKKTPRDIL